MKKVLKFLDLLLPVVVALGIEIAATLIGMVLYYQSYIYAFFIRKTLDSRIDINILDLISYSDGPMLEFMDTFLQIISFIVPLLWVIAFYLWYRFLKQSERISAVKTRSIVSLKNGIILSVAALGMQLAVTGAMNMVLPYFTSLSEEYTELMETLFEGNPIIIFISIVILAPLSEELLCRGVIMKKALRIMPFAWANVCQALLFAFLHMNLVQGTYAFIIGLVLGFVAYRFRSIKASILLHLLFNALSYVLIEPKNQLVLILYLVIGVVLAIVSLSAIPRLAETETEE